MRRDDHLNPDGASELTWPRLELADALRVITAKMTNRRRTGPALWKPITELSGPTTLPIAFETRPAS